MSLFEQFHSDINKNYMFNMIKTIITKEFNKDITGEGNYNSFINTLEKVFKENDSDDISDLNKILLDIEVGKYRVRYGPELEEQVVVSNNNKARSMEDLIKQREQQNKLPIINEGGEIKEKKNVFGTSIETLIVDKKDEIIEEGIIKEKVIIKEEKLKSISINSSQRKSINSSRYNYMVNLKDNDIESKDIKYVSKMIIPIEDNYMFSIPVLILKIPELNINIHMQQEDNITTSKGSFGIYEPINKQEININDVNKITIQISDVSESDFPSIDILKVNIVQIKDNKLGLTCSNINKMNYKIGDNIKIINNHTYDLYKLSKTPLKINNIIDNIIYCWLPDKFNNCKHDNSDMKILNLSNQNIIFFNQQV
jgi:hypothetical protein